MQRRARKLVVIAVAAALAVSNGFAPRHAQAGPHVPHASHFQEQAPLKGEHHHDAGSKPHAVAKPPCHNDDEGSVQTGSLIHNCCVASCSAVAFIFATFDLDTSLPPADYGVVLPAQLTPAALTSDDPPPR